MPELIVPVPLHPARYRERGFNQAHGYSASHGAGRRLGVPVAAKASGQAQIATREQSGLQFARAAQECARVRLRRVQPRCGREESGDC